ncbi:hypothetical protein [Paraburkholderia atlantica]|uniref:hypothetical protein n=1 Tax=Paraburkholderia atlantica TaxID=2654982 RepID=UPI001620A3D7|nr:hypothetical protein [Paraburkholderia atlantica]MBB5414087.1 hypothetical protein [Paraburkholderia atlantica]
MTQDQSDQIEELLLAWHRWQSTYSEKLGMPRCSPTCREYEIPAKNQTDQERSEAVDAKIFKRNGEAVDACVDALPRWEHRAAIQTSMTNKRAGYSVFSNPRLSPEQSHAFYQEAKSLLLPKFEARGLIKIMEVA